MPTVESTAFVLSQRWQIQSPWKRPTNDYHTQMSCARVEWRRKRPEHNWKRGGEKLDPHMCRDTWEQRVTLEFCQQLNQHMQFHTHLIWKGCSHSTVLWNTQVIFTDLGNELWKSRHRFVAQISFKQSQKKKVENLVSCSHALAW